MKSITRPPPETKLYWYGMNADPLTETDGAGGNANEYVFFGGKRIARRDASGNVNYYFCDHLGSSRVVTSATGTILDDCDFVPFGQERCYQDSSTNRYKFTGKERDAETGNDYFGARYYPNTLFRWLSPDPITAAPGRLTDPQQLNLYSYIRNNPPGTADLQSH
jgi:RHS repeat-associated protein